LFYCSCEKKLPESTVTGDTTSQNKKNELNIKSSIKTDPFLENFIEFTSKSNGGHGPEICECGWSRKEIMDTIARIVPKLSIIYHNKLLTYANLKGKIVFRFSILFKSGTVKNITTVSQQTNDTNFNNEIINVLKLINFDSIDCPCDSLCVFDYPFVFNNQN
jgi:hypothetical protein